MKNFKLLILILIITSCTQEPVKVVYNDKKIFSKNNYLNYNKGSYKTSPDGRVVRDITLKEEETDNSNNKEKKEDSNNINEEYDYVVVKPDDSLYRIAKNNNIDLEILAKLNNIDKSYNIIIGQKIKIPKNTNSENNKTQKPDTNNIKQNNNGYHLVNKGETLYSISKAYGIDMDEIIRINNLEKPYNLALGQKLLIKAVEEPKKPENTIQVVQKTTTVAGKEIEKVTKIDNSDEFIWPTKGELVKKFGDKINDVYHDGINIKSPKSTDVKASKSGEVAYSGNELKGYGNIIILRHDNNWLTIYAHCDELKVRQGDSVKQGDIIATVGNTGNVDDSQLYFSIREGRDAKDPLKFLK